MTRITPALASRQTPVPSSPALPSARADEGPQDKADIRGAIARVRLKTFDGLITRVLNMPTAIAATSLPAPFAWAVSKIAPLKMVLGPAGDAEPRPVHGARYLIDGDQVRTHVDALPAEAVKNGRVFIGIEGVGGHMDWYQDRYRTTLMSDKAGAVNINQPLVGIHEGICDTRIQDFVRDGKDFAYLKALQGGNLDNTSIEHIFENDPAVKTTYDSVKAALDQGVEAVLVPHSGGGMESALALTLLKNDGYGDAIGQHVRVVAISSAASDQDFMEAGVTRDNLYYTTSTRDPLFPFAHRFVDPLNPTRFFARMAPTVKHIISNGLKGGGAEHDPINIVGKNAASIQAFLDGAPGETHYYK